MHHDVRHLQAKTRFVNAVKQVLEMVIEMKNEKRKKIENGNLYVYLSFH